ncbi:MAG: HD domain-containing protein [Lachnospiraceae bacterium]|nr:HD domain-containing protein [Lachnospiraceae bacterium]
MTEENYLQWENYMLSCMEDSAHDKEHIYRVLYMALEIARTEQNVDYDVLVCACLLHDIGRKEQYENPAICHAKAGADKAYAFLVENHYAKAFAERVSRCIRVHRFRKDCRPENIEEKILFDADKIDVSGTIGIARTLMYKGQLAQPLYSLTPDGQVSDGTDDSEESFFQEYKYKLEGIYDSFYTVRGKEIAKARQDSAVNFYRSMLQEVRAGYGEGRELLREVRMSNKKDRKIDEKDNAF